MKFSSVVAIEPIYTAKLSHFCMRDPLLSALPSPDKPEGAHQERPLRRKVDLGLDPHWHRNALSRRRPKLVDKYPVLAIHISRRALLCLYTRSLLLLVYAQLILECLVKCRRRRQWIN